MRVVRHHACDRSREADGEERADRNVEGRCLQRAEREEEEIL